MLLFLLSTVIQHYLGKLCSVKHLQRVSRNSLDATMQTLRSTSWFGWGWFGLGFLVAKHSPQNSFGFLSRREKGFRGHSQKCGATDTLCDIPSRCSDESYTEVGCPTIHVLGGGMVIPSWELFYQFEEALSSAPMRAHLAQQE